MLGISGVNTSSSAWSKRADDEEGTQIDLLIIRDDNVINMCELKFYSGEFDVDNKYYKTLLENTLFCVSYESGVAKRIERLLF